MLLRSNFSSFPQYFQYVSNFRSQITYWFVKCYCSIFCFPHYCNSDISRYGSLEVFRITLEFEITRVDCKWLAPDYQCLWSGPSWSNLWFSCVLASDRHWALCFVFWLCGSLWCFHRWGRGPYADRTYIYTPHSLYMSYYCNIACSFVYCLFVCIMFSDATCEWPENLFLNKVLFCSVVCNGIKIKGGVWCEEIWLKFPISIPTDSFKVVPLLQFFCLCASVFVAFVLSFFLCVCVSSLLLLVPRKVCASWLWHFLGILTYGRTSMARTSLGP